MGETTDQLREQVDQKRSDASDKISKIEEQVTNTAQQMTDKATEAVDQVKSKMDWRQQVEERPLVMVGAAFVGGMLLGGVTGGGGKSSSGSTSTGSSGGGIGGTVRNAMHDSGLEQDIQQYTKQAFSVLADRVRTIAGDTFPGMMDKMQSTTGNQERSTSMSGAESEINGHMASSTRN
jgi:ElaB/YqjD/DUF883 family membrane-anchored ribosome-binding protein